MCIAILSVISEVIVFIVSSFKYAMRNDMSDEYISFLKD